MPTIHESYQNAEWSVLCSALEQPKRFYELRREFSRSDFRDESARAIWDASMGFLDAPDGLDNLRAETPLLNKLEDDLGRSSPVYHAARDVLHADRTGMKEDHEWKNWKARLREIIRRHQQAVLEDRLGKAKSVEECKLLIAQWDELQSGETGSQGEPSLLQKLEDRRFDYEVVHPAPVPALTLGGHLLASKGQIVSLQAPMKAGKSAAISGILGAIFGGNRDCLGFECPEGHGGKAIIHFDTEQNRHDADRLVRRSVYRAGVDKPPVSFSSFRLRDLRQEERREALTIVMEGEAEKHGGIYSVSLDGVADLCRSLNDDEEAFGLVQELCELTTRFDCFTIAAIHENPGSENGKTRGHLGSELQRKAETNLRLQKNPEGITTMFSPNSRNNSFGKLDGFCFRWCDEAKMHVSCGPAAVINEKAELNKQRREAANAFSRAKNGAKSMRYTELVDCTKKALGLKDRSAKDRIKGWRESGTVKEGENGSLEINGAEVQNGANP